jgi:PhnB protein
MKNLVNYLNFDGDARDAMTFYHQCLGGDLNIQTFKDARMDSHGGSEDRVIHANLMRKGGAFLMASDTMPGTPYKQGNNFSINIECDSVAEEETLFAALGEGGKVTMPLQDTFWNARFGMLTDRFGVSWMFNCELPKKG